MHLGNYLALLTGSETALAEAFATIRDHHRDEPDIGYTCWLLGTWSQAHVQALAPSVARYQAQKSAEPERLMQTLFAGPRTGSLALMRDLQDVWLLANQVDLCWNVITQAAQALRDGELEALYRRCQPQTQRQIAWLLSRIKQAAPQALVVAA